jgi:hypothetical protein
MASKLPYPSTPRHLQLFRNRIKQSVPSQIDAKWLQTALAIPSESNARLLLSALKGAGFVDEAGVLTERGKALRDSEQSQGYRQAMIEAAEQLLGQECVDSIRAGILSNESLPGFLRKQTSLGESAVSKALAGVRWLVEEGGDEVLLASVSRSKRASTGGNRRDSVRRARREPAPRNSEPTPSNPDTLEKEIPGPNIPSSEVRDGSVDSKPYTSLLLETGALKAVIDSGWGVEGAQRVIRMMQLVERGELVPEPDARDDSE